MKTDFKYHLFEVYGVELEYMIVDRDTLNVRPIADELLKSVTGSYVADYENGTIDWSNELVSHVIELKCHRPESSLADLEAEFHKNVREVNKILATMNAMLLPTASHPSMDPFTETKIWPHEYNEIYELYNRLFDCRGHGWSNLQSTHINLPFANDEEFGKLHAAVRVLLPIIPALTASSPFHDGKATGYCDSRMVSYLGHQEKMPSLMGALIPEAVFSRQDYYDRIFSRIINDIRPHDKDGVMEHHFLNSRGAIARFDRGAIEIRVLDIQECPKADIAILQLIVECLKLLISEQWVPLDELKRWDEKHLLNLFRKVIVEAENAEINDMNYLTIFGINKPGISIRNVWSHILDNSRDNISSDGQHSLTQIIEQGSLASRILKRSAQGQSIEAIYRELARCAEENKLLL